MENQRSFLVCKIIVFGLAVGFLAGFGGCSSNKSNNVLVCAVAGGVLGGGIGALASSASTTTASYVATGAVIGTGAGALIGAAASEGDVDSKKDAKSAKKCVTKKCADKNAKK